MQRAEWQHPVGVSQCKQRKATSREFKIRVQKPIYSGSRCVVPMCSNRQGTDKILGIVRSYYRFPRGKDKAKLRKQWEEAIRRGGGWKSSDSDRICSDHFESGKRTHVKGTLGYIPSKFAWNATTSQQRLTETSGKAGAISPIPWCEDSWAPKIDKPKGLSGKAMRNIREKEEEKIRVAKENTQRVWYMTGHDYVETTREKSAMGSEENLQVHSQLAALDEQNKEMRGQIFCLELIKDNDSEFQRYTNLPNYAVFKAVCDYLDSVSGGNLNYWRAGRTGKNKHYSLEMQNKPGVKRKLSFENEFFMVLVKLKTGNFNHELAMKFGVSETTVSKIFTTWLNFLHRELTLLFQMKCNWDDIETIPECFHRFRGLISVIDCTELQVERSSCLQARKETYSNYKSRDTVKFMVGLSPNLTVNFVSNAYGGRASDKKITLSSDDFLNAIPPNASIMADKGFNISEELRKKGVKLIIPDFKGRNRSQFSPAEAAHCESVSNARIHVERIIQRIRTFHILDTTMRISQQDITSQIFCVCSYLVNFQMPIVNMSEAAPTASPDSSENDSIFDFI